MTRLRLIRLALLYGVGILGAACDPSPKEPPAPKPTSRIPHHPSFTLIYRRSNSSRASVLYTDAFASKASYEDVKEFYVRVLGPQGWKLTKEKPITVDGYGTNAREFEMVREHETLTVGYSGENRRRFSNENYYLWHWVKTR